MNTITRDIAGAYGPEYVRVDRDQYGLTTYRWVGSDGWHYTAKDTAPGEYSITVTDGDGGGAEVVGVVAARDLLGIVANGADVIA